MILRADARHLPLRDGSVHCCVTSPPYWGLRDYGTATWEGGDTQCDHVVDRFSTPVSKKQASNRASGSKQARASCPKCGAVRSDIQIGLERTPDEYVAEMVAVFREVWRVLRDDGTAWLNLGDSYTSGGRRTRDPGRSTKHQPFDGNRYRDGLRPSTPENLKAKDLVGIPWRVAFALQADGWYLRSDIIWAKPNPMPESVQDRPTRAHEYVFLLAKSPRYHYNADAVAQIPAASSVARLAQPGLPDQRGSNRVPGKTNGPMRACFGGRNKHAGYGGRLASGREDSGHYLTRGTNMRSVLAIGGAGFRGSHFAVMPERLAALCILAGCPEGGTVLDPFCGSGTTGVVAAKYGRRFVGIDISKEFCRMALKRMAPHLAQGGLFAPCGAAPGKVEAQ